MENLNINNEELGASKSKAYNSKSSESISTKKNQDNSKIDQPKNSKSKTLKQASPSLM